MAFGVAAGEGAAAVGHLFEGDDDLGVGGKDASVDGVKIGVRDDKRDGAGLGSADLVGLLDEATAVVVVGAGLAPGAEHDHAGAEGELRVGDRVVGTGVDSLPLEAKDVAEPIDGLGCAAVAHAGDD